MSALSNLRLHCTQDIISTAISDCPNTNSSPDGVSYRLLKFIQEYHHDPLTIIFQHFIFEGVFPHIGLWKRAIIMPLYKGLGAKSAVDSYRSISLCSCIRKLLEKVVNLQLNAHLHDNGLLQQMQQDFIPGRSTLTNLLVTETYIKQLAATEHAYDIITFDFAKAFDKAPHDAVNNA